MAIAMTCDRRQIQRLPADPVGIHPRDIEPGSAVFVSPCRCCNDPRYVGLVWEVVSVESGRVIVVPDTTPGNFDSIHRPQISVLPTNRFSFYDAEITRQKLRTRAGLKPKPDMPPREQRRPELDEATFLRATAPPFGKKSNPYSPFPPPPGEDA